MVACVDDAADAAAAAAAAGEGDDEFGVPVAAKTLSSVACPPNEVADAVDAAEGEGEADTCGADELLADDNGDGGFGAAGVEKMVEMCGIDPRNSRAPCVPACPSVPVS